MTIRAAIERATDAAGRIRWTRALAEAVAEADARLAASSPARQWALAREIEEALGVGDTRGPEQLDRAVEAVRSLRDRAERAERERDEARADAALWLSQCSKYCAAALRYGRERDEARAVAEIDRPRAAMGAESVLIPPPCTISQK